MHGNPFSEVKIPEFEGLDTLPLLIFCGNWTYNYNFLRFFYTFYGI